MGKLAAAYEAAGQLDKALPLFEVTLEKQKAKLGPDHPDTLRGMNNLAAAYWTAKRLDRSLPLFEVALTLFQAKFGPDHPSTLNAQANLGVNYRDAGRLDEALELLEETLAKRKAKLGPDHPDTLTSMHELASAYEAAGQLDKGFLLHEQTLEKRKAKLGPDHPDTLTSMNNVAVAYWRTQRLDRSVPLFEEALTLYQGKLGADHPETLNTQANLGINYFDVGRVEEGIHLVENAMELATAGGKPLPAKLARIRSMLAEMYDRAGEFAKGEPLFSALLEQARVQFGNDDPRTAGPMASLSLCLLHQRKNVEAEPLVRECLSIREAKEPHDWRTFNTKSLLGGSLLGQEMFAEAEPLLVAGYEGMRARQEKIPPVARIRLTEAMERLVRLYEATGDKGQADMWRKKVADAADEKPQP
jgi:tetratricopeptide (TPR) repeat protein